MLFALVLSNAIAAPIDAYVPSQADVSIGGIAGIGAGAGAGVGTDLTLGAAWYDLPNFPERFALDTSLDIARFPGTSCEFIEGACSERNSLLQVGAGVRYSTSIPGLSVGGKLYGSRFRSQFESDQAGDFDNKFFQFRPGFSARYDLAIPAGFGVSGGGLGLPRLTDGGIDADDFLVHFTAGLVGLGATGSDFQFGVGITVPLGGVVVDAADRYYNGRTVVDEDCTFEVVARDHELIVRASTEGMTSQATLVDEFDHLFADLTRVELKKFIKDELASEAGIKFNVSPPGVPGLSASGGSTAKRTIGRESSISNSTVFTEARKVHFMVWEVDVYGPLKIQEEHIFTERREWVGDDCESAGVDPNPVVERYSVFGPISEIPARMTYRYFDYGFPSDDFLTADDVQDLAEAEFVDFLEHRSLSGDETGGWLAQVEPYPLLETPDLSLPQPLEFGDVADGLIPTGE